MTIENNTITMQHYYICGIADFIALHTYPSTLYQPHPTPPLHPTHTLPIKSQRKNSGSSARIFLFYRVGLFDFLLMILKTFKRLLMYTQFPKAKTNPHILFNISRQTKFLIKDMNIYSKESLEVKTCKYF